MFFVLSDTLDLDNADTDDISSCAFIVLCDLEIKCVCYLINETINIISLTLFLFREMVLVFESIDV